MRRANVLVLLLILTIGIALFASFAGTTRDAANRAKCSNNLKQLALALHSYHDTWGILPAATIPNDLLLPDERFSWYVTIWPYIEGGVGPNLDLKKGWKAEGNRPVTLWYHKTREEHVLDGVPLFMCGAERNVPLQYSVGITHYIGMAGIGADAPVMRAPVGPGLEHRLGIFGYDRQTRLGDVTDGWANTISVVETALDNGPWTAGGPPTVRGINQALQPYLGTGRQFGGLHNRGTNAGLVDGSVKFLSNSTSPQVFEALATIAGGERVPASDY